MVMNELVVNDKNRDGFYSVLRFHKEIIEAIALF